MARVLAIANQKGGVAKTTTAQTVGLALADLGERVLLVDLDPQACLTFALGLEPEQCGPTLHDVLLQRVKATDAVIDVGRVQLLPANIDLAGSEVRMDGSRVALLTPEAEQARDRLVKYIGRIGRVARRVQRRADKAALAPSAR